MNKFAKSLHEHFSQYLIILFLILASFNLIAQDSDESEYIESVTIIGSVSYTHLTLPTNREV